MPGIRYCRPIINAVAVVAALALAEGPRCRAPAVTPGSAGWARRSGAVSRYGEAVMLVRSRADEITFAGRAGGMQRAACDDGAVTAGPGMTTLRAKLPDRAGLWGLVQLIMGLGLELVDLHLVTAGSW